MAWTQTDIDKLKAAMASGVLSVRYGVNHQVQYQSLDDMARQLKRMEDEVAAANGSSNYRRSVASYSSGLR